MQHRHGQWRLPGKSSPSQPDLFADRYRLIRQGLRKLTRQLDWMSMDFASARRNFSSVDETFRLVEGVAAIQTQGSTGALLQGSAPTRFDPARISRGILPRPPRVPPVGCPTEAAGGPLPAHCPLVDRQPATPGAASFGGRLQGDTRLAAHWPGIALMDGPAPRLKQSLISLIEARLNATGLWRMGLNRQVQSCPSGLPGRTESGSDADSARLRQPPLDRNADGDFPSPGSPHRRQPGGSPPLSNPRG